MNREEFTDVFYQNIQITGGKARAYSMLVYSGTDGESLIPALSNQNLLTVPVGNGFRISISRSEKKLLEYSTGKGSKSVRATRKAFSGIMKSGRNLGFKLCDLTLKRGEKEIITVKNDPVIAEDMYSRYSGDPYISPTYLGFTNGLSTVTFEIGMKIGFTEYSRETGYLIYDAVSGVLGDINIYHDIQNAFQPKRSDDEVSVINPVKLECQFEDATKLINYLEAFFSEELEMKASSGKNVNFASPDGTWGEFVIKEDRILIYYRSRVDFNLGIRLLDALNLELMN